MKKQQANRIRKSIVATPPTCPLPPFLRLNQPKRHRQFRIVLPALPRRQPCMSGQRVLAAERAAELAFWQVTGGDFLRSSLATDFILAWQARPN